MKNLAYIYKQAKRDINGNPKHWVTLYWIKRGEPVRIGRSECGYIGVGPTLTRLAAENGLITQKQADLRVSALKEKKIAIFHEIEI